jgi:Skp family chaperone for outer membrane proteins
MGQMLNRVRDFRYEEIKNWKPLVSLRESYRKESAIKNMILLATCILAILIGYSVINGSLRITGRPSPIAQQGAAANTPAGEAAVRAALPQDLTEASRSRVGETADRDATGIAQIPTFGTRGSLQQVNYQKAATDLPNSNPEVAQRSSGIAAPATMGRLRVAVCDVQRIINTELTNYAASLATESERELRAEKESLYERSQHFTDVEVLILQKLFEQKKKLAVVEIRQRVQQYRELADRQLRVIADRVADESGFDLVLTADQVLSYTQPADITRQVSELWMEQRQIQAQRERQNRLGIR